MSVVRVYSEMMETKKYPIPGMPSFASKWKRSNEAKIDERLDDISLHALIRRDGEYAADIRAMELQFQKMETVSTAELSKYKKLISVAAVRLLICFLKSFDKLLFLIRLSKG